MIRLKPILIPAFTAVLALVLTGCPHDHRRDNYPPPPDHHDNDHHDNDNHDNDHHDNDQH